jgi:hypothetical protein
MNSELVFWSFGYVDFGGFSRKLCGFLTLEYRFFSAIFCYTQINEAIWLAEMAWILRIHPTPSCASCICNWAKEKGHMEESINERYETGRELMGLALNED